MVKILTIVAVIAVLIGGYFFASGRQAAVGNDPAAATDGATSVTGAEAYHKITAEQAKQMMEAQKVTVVDVRTEVEYREGHVPGAIVIPVESIADEMPTQLPDKAATLLVYCRSGRRSKLAADKLVAMGYQNVYDFGGINDWPYEVAQD